MSDKAEEIATENGHSQTPATKGACRGKAGIFIVILAIVIIVCVFGYGYFQLAKVNVSLAQMVSDLRNQTAKNQNELSFLQNTVTDLQQAAQKSQELSAKQEQMIADWQAAQKGNLDKWYVAEAQYLVKLANDHLQFTHNISMAKTLLARADTILQNLQDPSLLELRKSLAADLANLQAAATVDVTALYLQLTALNQQMDQLPLPINPLKADTTTQAAAVNTQGLSWWKAGLNYTVDALRKIVIVRYNTSNTLPLVMPEEKAFLYQNLHAQMEDAMWGVLHHNVSVYQASLARAIMWIQEYFDQDAQATKFMFQNLQELIKINVAPPAINLSTTLQLFDNYFAKVNAAP